MWCARVRAISESGECLRGVAPGTALTQSALPSLKAGSWFTSGRSSALPCHTPSDGYLEILVVEEIPSKGAGCGCHFA
jgi:hypothetical protein